MTHQLRKEKQQKARERGCRHTRPQAAGGAGFGAGPASSKDSRVHDHGGPVALLCGQACSTVACDLGDLGYEVLGEEGCISSQMALLCNTQGGCQRG